METFSRETLDPWFVTGFVDAQGLFTFSRSSRQIALYFTLKSEDRVFLEAIREFFGGIGAIYNAGSKALFRVTRAAELLAIARHFDSYPLHTAQKRATYDVWRRMVELKRTFRRPAREEVEALARELSRTVARRS